MTVVGDDTARVHVHGNSILPARRSERDEGTGSRILTIKFHELERDREAL